MIHSYKLPAGSCRQDHWVTMMSLGATVSAVDGFALVTVAIRTKPDADLAVFL